MRLKYHKYYLTIAIAIYCLGDSPCYAQQPISGNYAPGAFTGMKGALTPPHGKFMVENGTMYYNTRDFVNSNGETQETATVNALANRTVISYVPKFKILGGRYFPGIIIPFANVAIRPQPGSEKAFQMGDLILQPLGLGWTKGTLNWQVTYTLWLPTARFNAGASNNVGKGLFSHLFSGGLTWLQEEKYPWAATIVLRYEILGKQRDTNIEPGNVLIVEGGVGKELVKGFDVGLTYYYMTQTNEEKGSNPGTDTSVYMAASIGPELNWRPNGLSGFQASVRSYFEFTASNTSQGVFTVLSLAYIFPQLN